MSISAWNLMGGIDWNALPYMVERFGIVNVDAFVARLIAIRDFQEATEKAQRG